MYTGQCKITKTGANGTAYPILFCHPARCQDCNHRSDTLLTR